MGGDRCGGEFVDMKTSSLEKCRSNCECSDQERGQSSESRQRYFGSAIVYHHVCTALVASLLNAQGGYKGVPARQTAS